MIYSPTTFESDGTHVELFYSEEAQEYMVQVTLPGHRYPVIHSGFEGPAHAVRHMFKTIDLIGKKIEAECENA